MLIRHLVGFSDNTDSKHYRVVDEKKKLTIWEMNTYVTILDPLLCFLLTITSYDMYLDIDGKLGIIPDTNGLPN